MLLQKGFHPILHVLYFLPNVKAWLICFATLQIGLTANKIQQKTSWFFYGEQFSFNLANSGPMDMGQWVTHFTGPVWKRWHLRCSVFTYSVISFEEKGSKKIGVEMCIRKKNVHWILIVSTQCFYHISCARKSKLKWFQEGFLKTSRMKWKLIKTQDLGWLFGQESRITTQR